MWLFFRELFLQLVAVAADAQEEAQNGAQEAQSEPQDAQKGAQGTAVPKIIPTLFFGWACMCVSMCVRAIMYVRICASAYMYDLSRHALASL